MAISLLTQQDVRPLRRFSFCYLCGRTLPAGSVADPDERANDDHVPPSSLFLKADRNFPLILPTHYQCNHGRHMDDQTIGQLVGLLHDQAPDPQHPRIEFFAGMGADGVPIVAAAGFDLRDIIRRWVCGFHAALYREALPAPDSFMTFPPLAEADRETGSMEPVPDLVPVLVRTLRENRATRTLDRIVCRNSKCVYECVWLQGDRGEWFCAYALDLYGWSSLGDTARHGMRGCVGAYRRVSKGPPPDASTGTRLVFELPFANAPLDPFPSE